AQRGVFHFRALTAVMHGVGQVLKAGVAEQSGGDSYAAIGAVSAISSQSWGLRFSTAMSRKQVKRVVLNSIARQSCSSWVRSAKTRRQLDRFVTSANLAHSSGCDGASSIWAAAATPMNVAANARPATLTARYSAVATNPRAARSTMGTLT